MMKHLILLLALISTPALALDGWIDIHIGSIHDKSMLASAEEKMVKVNEFNPGIGLSIRRTDTVDMKLGVFRNSYSTTSYYGGVDAHTSSRRTFGVGVMLGIITGYEVAYKGLKVIPAVVPHVTIQGRLVRAELSFLSANTANAIALTVGFRF